MPNKRLIFLPYKLHLRFFLFELAKRIPVTVMLPPEKTLPEGTQIKGMPIQYKQFGADKIKRLTGKEARTMKYVSGLSKKLNTQDARTILTCEFYHWYTLQALAYKKRHNDIKLFLVSETKRLPRNIIARIVKRVLLYYFRKNVKYYSGVFVYTQQAMEFMQQHVPEARVMLLPTPVNTQALTYTEDRTYCPDGTPRLLMSARYAPYKRHKDIFEAIKNLRDDGSSVHLTCISRDGKNEQSVKDLAQAIGVSNLVTFLDKVQPEEVSELYATHDVLILPSYNEAIGMVVPEAMACGLSTVTSDTVGANLYVKDGETGFIFKTGDVDALTSTLKQCFNAELLARMGKEAHQRILSEFTPESVVDAFLHNLA